MKILAISEKFKGLAEKLPKNQKERFLIILGSVIFVFIVYVSITYNSKLKKERLEAINSFLSNNDTILLKNYLLNQIKSPYLEYDYLIINESLEKSTNEVLTILNAERKRRNRQTYVFDLVEKLSK